MKLVVSKTGVIHNPIGNVTICNGVGVFYPIDTAEIKIKKDAKFCRKCFGYGRPKGI